MRHRLTSAPARLSIALAVIAGAAILVTLGVDGKGGERRLIDHPNPGAATRSGTVVPVEFPSSNGLILRGHLYGSGERWAVLIHDEGQDLDAWQPLVAELQAIGLSVLLFDLRGHGASDDPWNADEAPADVDAALRFAKTRGATSTYVIGAGAGATAGLAAAGARDVRALVALSPRAVLGSLPRDVIRDTRAPKLIMMGALDSLSAEQADDVYRRSIGWSVLESVPVRDQGTGLLASAWGGHAREHIAAFLRDYL